jgi:hypothetical protein
MKVGPGLIGFGLLTVLVCALLYLDRKNHVFGADNWLFRTVFAEFIRPFSSRPAGVFRPTLFGPPFGRVRPFGSGFLPLASAGSGFSSWSERE